MLLVRKAEAKRAKLRALARASALGKVLPLSRGVFWLVGRSAGASLGRWVTSRGEASARRLPLCSRDFTKRQKQQQKIRANGGK